MMVSGLHLDPDSFVILADMKSTVRLLAMAIVAAVVSCTPYRQESGTPMPPDAPSASPPPSTAGTPPVPPVSTEPPSIVPQGGAVPAPAPTTDYPYAEKTSTPGLVISPYAPYNVMDVKGIPSGKLALDPSCQKKFRVP
jgi:hypothetical protein